MRNVAIILLLSAVLGGCTLLPKRTQDNNQLTPTPTTALSTPPTTAPQTTKQMENKPKRAILKTSLGDITVELYVDKAPQTVANFAALSEGTQEWLDPETKTKQVGVPYYKNIIFHRIIKDFMLQGGDITGTGRGGPGYQFKDEFDSSLIFDQPGILAMANSGPNTNGSQFFITTVPTPWLNGKHTIFGKVVTGMDVVKKIEAVETDMNDKPLTDVVLKEVVIER